MSITESELKRRLRPWVKELIMAGGGSGGPFLSGSGTTGQVAEWGASTVLQAASLAKTGAGLLTLASAGAYTLTVPLTGTAVVGSGVAGRLAAWADNNTVGASGGLTTAGDLIYMSSSGAVETDYTEFLESTLENLNWDSGTEAVEITITLPTITALDTARITINIWASSYSGFGDRATTLRLRRSNVSGTILATHVIPAGADGGHVDNWAEIVTDATPATTYVITAIPDGGATPKSDYRYVKLARAVITTAPDRLPIGTAGDVLRVSGGLPVWQSLSTAGIVPTSRTITEGAGLAGNTYDLSANRTLAMGTPSTLTVSTTNSASGTTHAHAITSSSNPGANARILASNASGYLSLLRIGLGMAPSFPLDVTGQGRLVATSTADANTVGWVANLTKTAGVDDTRTNSAFQTTLTLAGTFAYSGVNSGMTATLNHSGSGLAGDLSGIYFIGGVASTGNVTTFDIIRARPFGAGAGVISTLSAFHIYDIAATGTPTSAFGVRIDASTSAVGTSKYGISIGNISGASTNNVAINTAAGLINFGDQVKIDGSADRIQEIVQAHSTQTANLTEWQASNAAVLGYVSGTGTVKTSGSRAAVTTKTANYTATVNDEVIVANKATAITITLPAATNTGQHYHISSIGAGACTIQCNAAETIWGSNTQTLYQYESIDIWDYGTGVWTA